jgi:hypothetical protein
MQPFIEFECKKNNIMSKIERKKIIFMFQNETTTLFFYSKKFTTFNYFFSLLFQFNCLKNFFFI